MEEVLSEAAQDDAVGMTSKLPAGDPGVESGVGKDEESS